MILPETMRCYLETIYHESQVKYTRLTLNALGGGGGGGRGVFSTPGEVFADNL